MVNNSKMEDSLKVTQQEDGSFEVEWDPRDSRYSVWNDLTSEELSAMMMEAIKEQLDAYSVSESLEHDE